MEEYLHSYDPDQREEIFGKRISRDEYQLFMILHDCGFLLKQGDPDLYISNKQQNSYNNKNNWYKLVKMFNIVTKLCQKAQFTKLNEKTHIVTPKLHYSYSGDKFILCNIKKKQCITFLNYPLGTSGFFLSSFKLENEEDLSGYNFIDPICWDRLLNMINVVDKYIKNIGFQQITTLN